MLPFERARAAQQQVGSIRGVVYDKEFETPLAGALVTAVEIGKTTTTTDQGNFVLSDMAPGRYTLVFAKEGYIRQVKVDVPVNAGQLTDLEIALAGEFTEMDEFVVQDVSQFAAGTEGALLEMRFESAALMDSISSELMSRAGASDAAAALRLVSGASVQDNKTAVIRGLPDRYVSSQMNGVRLPSADEDKRAVELDQFPASVIESIQVSKTFTPDQQGDASGGAVDVRLKSIPDETLFQVKAEMSANSQVYGEDEFLTYDGGGVDFWGRDDGGRDKQLDKLGQNWDGAVGVSTDDAPVDYKWSITAGGKHELGDGIRFGGLTSFFYERDSSFEEGFDDALWVDVPGQGLVPQTFQGAPDPSGLGDYKTGLFDYTRAKQSVQWGLLTGLGIESENHSVGLTYLYTRAAEDAATLAEDTRGKAYFDPTNQDPDSAPFLRLETLEYTERTTDTAQLHGQHELPFEGFRLSDSVVFKKPEFDWTLALSSAGMDQPDKRQFGSMWKQSNAFPGGFYSPYKPAANFSYGGLQRIWKDIEEDSDQYALNLKLPFDQWSGDEGYLKLGAFSDSVDRSFNQDTFSNFGDGAIHPAGWNESWSEVFPNQNHPIFASDQDVDYEGEQDLSAWYGMLDLPLAKPWNLIGGVRFESTEISTVNDAEQFAQWYPPGSTTPIALTPGAADVSFEQDDVLPSIGLVYVPIEQVTLRTSYSETVARQTFKELTPIVQQEYLGGPVFIGNPDLGMSALKNYDLRVDYTPYQGGLLSLSWFHKDVHDPIEYVQKPGDFVYTTAVNYPKGQLTGYELEVRQKLGEFWDPGDGFSLGANATFIDSEVSLPQDEIDDLSDPAIAAPMSKRDMTNAPEYLYNLYLTFDSPNGATQATLFYTVQGDTLVAGAGASDRFVPSVYAKEYDTLNFSLSQRVGKYFRWILQAKNLTNPRIEEVYRSEFIGSDVTKSSYTKGIEYSIGISASF